MKVRDVVGSAVLFIILFGIAYTFGTATLTINNSITVGQPAVNLFADTASGLTSCTSPPTGYSDANSQPIFVNVVAGSTSTYNVCVYNSGTAATHLLSFTFTPVTVTGVSASIPSTTLTANTPSLVTITYTATTSATSGTATISFG